MKTNHARIAIIGAGMAGLVCARRLVRAGLRPVVFDKGRAVGGRVATRISRDGFSFDHGAQFVTAHSAEFRDLLAEAIGADHASVWRPVREDKARPDSAEWVVGTPGMGSLVAHLASSLDVSSGVEVTGLEQVGEKWLLHFAGDGAPVACDIVVSTAPASQSRALFGVEREIGVALKAVEMDPCWALMLAFEQRLDRGFDVIRPEGTDLDWICRDSSKPSRESERDLWVLHASPDWSRRNLELERDEAGALMFGMFKDLTHGSLPPVAAMSAHRWRYARTSAPLGRPFSRSQDGTAYAGGDWSLGARVEAAFQSGEAIAGDVLAAVGEA